MHKAGLKLGLLFQELTKEAKNEHTEAQEESFMWVKVKAEDVILSEGRNLLLMAKVQDVHFVHVCSGNRGCQSAVCVRCV